MHMDYEIIRADEIERGDKIQVPFLRARCAVVRRGTCFFCFFASSVASNIAPPSPLAFCSPRLRGGADGGGGWGVTRRRRRNVNVCVCPHAGYEDHHRFRWIAAISPQGGPLTT
jgi:hypothetical protein